MSIFKRAIYSDDDICSPLPFSVNNVGYTLIDNYKSVTNRPGGRNDYQIIYIKRGVGHFQFGEGQVVAVPQNNIVFYKPYQPQIYTYYPQDNTESYWIHFSGTEAEAFLKSLNLDKVKQLPFSDSYSFVSTVNKITNEMRFQRAHYNTVCVAELTKLLVLINRESASKKNKTNQTDAIQHICRDIEDNYFLDISNSEYADKYNMSVSNFLRLFKKSTGTTPLHYKLTLRIQMAENLLVASDYSISQIAQIVGFTDKLYFSRIFKKINSVSPSEYRKNALLKSIKGSSNS